MGLQQVLMLVIGVILVGIAIAVGIVMFNYQAFSANRQAIIAEIATFNTMAAGYWGTPVTMGGAGKDADNCDLEVVASYLGFSNEDHSKIVQLNFKYFSGNGEFRLLGAWDGQLEIVALGTSAFFGKFPYIRSTFDMMTNTTTTEISKEEEFVD